MGKFSRNLWEHSAWALPADQVPEGVPEHFWSLFDLLAPSLLFQTNAQLELVTNQN
jgi:hypothetical protein